MEERLQKVLAAAGVASRREAEKYITQGRVQVNGKYVTELGTKVDDFATITVDGKNIQRENKVYLLFYKPRGVVTTMHDPEGRPCIADYVEGVKERVYPVGRLDYNTEGLLLLTNDGTLDQRLTHPSHEVGKTYEVEVLGKVPQEKLDLLRIGVRLEDGLTAPALVELRGYDEERNFTTFTITIHEGRNRQVRRMCDFIGFPVRKLMRTQVGPLTLDGMKKGTYRRLDEYELTDLLEAAGMTEPMHYPIRRAPAEKKAEKPTKKFNKPSKKAEGENHGKGLRSSHRRTRRGR
jgi:23S rRNA pseudouridine2605 synthase